MLKLRFVVLSLFLAAPVFAQNQCDQDSLDNMQLCMDSCLEEAPGCESEVVNPIDELVGGVEDRCVYDSDGEPRPEQGCKLCINAILKEIAAGPKAKILKPLVGEVVKDLRDLKDICGKPLGDGDLVDPGAGDNEGAGGGAGK